MKLYLILGLLAVTGLSSCNKPDTLLDSSLPKGVGNECVIHLNRQVSGRITTVSGKLTRVGKKGIILEVTNDQKEVYEYWIPESSILMISFT